MTLKTMGRSELTFDIKMQYHYEIIKDNSFDGAISLIRFFDVKEPFKKYSFNQEYTLIGNDYYWLQVAPRDQRIWLTVLISPDHEVLQYYFDITKGNTIQKEDASFIDMYLDLLVHPSGQYLILDEDELQNAYDQNIISQLDVYETYAIMCDLINQLNPSKMEAFSLSYFKKLHPKLK